MGRVISKVKEILTSQEEKLQHSHFVMVCVISFFFNEYECLSNVL